MCLHYCTVSEASWIPSHSYSLMHSKAGNNHFLKILSESIYCVLTFCQMLTGTVMQCTKVFSASGTTCYSTLWESRLCTSFQCLRGQNVMPLYPCNLHLQCTIVWWSNPPNSICCMWIGQHWGMTFKAKSSKTACLSSQATIASACLFSIYALFSHSLESLIMHPNCNV